MYCHVHPCDAIDSLTYESEQGIPYTLDMMKCIEHLASITCVFIKNDKTISQATTESLESASR